MSAVAVGIVWYGPLFRAGRQLLEGQGRGAAAAMCWSVAVDADFGGDDGPQFRAGWAGNLHAKPWLYWMMSGGLALVLRLPDAVHRPGPPRHRFARSGDRLRLLAGRISRHGHGVLGAGLVAHAREELSGRIDRPVVAPQFEMEFAPGALPVWPDSPTRSPCLDLLALA